MLDRLRSAKSLGFLFCGGSSRCAFQIGVVEALHNLGVQPAVCLGVSGGAWNAAAVAVGNATRLRAYWRFFWRMPCVDLRNLLREHSPFIWSRLHRRAFERYVGSDRVRSAKPLYVGLTRIRDRSAVYPDVRTSSDPFRVLLASNYLPPFYTHPQTIDGERYADGGFVNNIPYEALFERGCDVVVMMNNKGEAEGGLQRRLGAPEHAVPPEYRDRLIVIRPRQRLPIRFLERRWPYIARVADMGRARVSELVTSPAL